MDSVRHLTYGDDIYFHAEDVMEVLRIGGEDCRRQFLERLEGGGSSPAAGIVSGFDQGVGYAIKLIRGGAEEIKRQVAAGTFGETGQ